MSDTKANILFVEDDLSLGMVTKDSLELKGYEVQHYEDGESAWEAFQEGTYDLCILDVMLPHLDGFSLAKRIRENNHQVPIIFLTAKSLQEDKIEGLRLGADDYMTKPFSIEELALKVEVFLKRSQSSTTPLQSNEPEVFEIGIYQFDSKNLTLKSPSETRQLTLREMEVLKMFAKNPEKVLRREIILEEIWGKNDYFMGRSLDVFITRLRKYLKEDERLRIENIPSVGFKLTLQK